MAKKVKKPRRKLFRKEESRYSGDTVLIVCEGEETEPNYLSALKDSLRLHQAAITIVPSSYGSAPKSVVQYAKQRIKDACKEGNPFTKVYCVIDKDKHSTYLSALSDIRTYKPTKKCATILCAIPSVPCFEYWILMHFVNSTRSYGTSGSSPCQHLIASALRTYLPHYSKTDKVKAKELVETKLTAAIRNSRMTLQAAKMAGTDDPSTYMHLLVEELEYLKNNGYFKDERKGCPS